MFLCELIYYSRVNDDLTEEVLDSILEVSQQSNKKHCITGALLLYQGYFVQCLEGHRDILSRLYSVIIQDTRHSDVRLVRFRTIHERAFFQWSMGKADASLMTHRLALQYSPEDTFNPELSSPKQIYKILTKLLR